MTVTDRLPHGGDCPDCGHPFDPHCLIPTQQVTLQGGIMLCPVKGCECLTTWDVPPFSDKDTVVVPPDEEIVRLRALFQGGQ